MKEERKEHEVPTQRNNQMFLFLRCYYQFKTNVYLNCYVRIRLILVIKPTEPNRTFLLVHAPASHYRAKCLTRYLQGINNGGANKNSCSGRLRGRCDLPHLFAKQ